MTTEVGSPGFFGGIVVAPVWEPVDVKTTTPGLSEAVKVTVAFDIIVPPWTTSVVVSHSVQVLLMVIRNASILRISEKCQPSSRRNRNVSRTLDLERLVFDHNFGICWAWGTTARRDSSHLRQKDEGDRNLPLHLAV